MKKNNIHFLIIFFCSIFYQNIQAMWYDSTAFSLNHNFQEGDIVVLDSLQFDLDASYVERLNKPQKIYELCDFLKKRQEWTVQIYVLCNTNYDTTSNHFLRTRAKDIYNSLIYFNVAPLQFQVKDSIVAAYDKDFSGKKTFMKIIVVFKKKLDYTTLLNHLNEAYKEKNSEILHAYIDKMSLDEVIKGQNIEVSTDLESYQIKNLINQFYEQFYSIKQTEHYPILPYQYKIALGKVERIIFPYDESIEEPDLTTSGFTSVSSIPERFYQVVYHYPVPTQKIIYLNEIHRRALENFLQYNFSYKVDEMTNIPSHIQPINSTKEKLKKIKKYIKPTYNYEINGVCNAHSFWNFQWDFYDAFTPQSILIDEKSKAAFIEFKDEKRKIKYAKYQLINTDWTFVEVIELGRSPIIPLWKYFMGGIIGLFLFAMVGVKITMTYA